MLVVPPCDAGRGGGVEGYVAAAIHTAGETLERALVATRRHWGAAGAAMLCWQPSTGRALKLQWAIALLGSSEAAGAICPSSPCCSSAPNGLQAHGNAKCGACYGSVTNCSQTDPVHLHSTMGPFSQEAGGNRLLLANDGFLLELSILCAAAQ